MGEETGSGQDCSSGDDGDDKAKEWLLSNEERDSVIKDALTTQRECAIGREVRVAFEGESLEDATLRGKVRSWDAESEQFR